MANKSYGWALILIVVVFAVGAIVAYRHNHARSLILSTASLAYYENDTYGYSFYYPPEYTVRVWSNEDAIIGYATSTSFVTYVESRIATSSPDAPSYDDFIVSQSQALCSVLAGYTCSGVAERSTYTTETNLAGAKLYLNLTTSDGTQQRFGPIYIFNVGANVTDAKYAALFVYRPLGAEGAVEIFPAESIAAKVNLMKAKK